MATGTSTIDFGAAPGSWSATTTITGQAAILGGSHVEAFMMAETGGDHTDDEVRVMALSIGLTCGNVVAGTGFDIYAVADQQLVGAWPVRWVWA